MSSESHHKWGWKHVNVYGMFDRGSGTKRWRCNHCNQCYNGSYSRVRAHLLGFHGFGVKPCSAIDFTTREIFNMLEKEHQPKKMKKKLITKKYTSKLNNNGKCLFGSNCQALVDFSPLAKNQTAGDVDEAVSRFFYMDGLNLNVVKSSYFREMAKAIGGFGRDYEPPTVGNLSGFLLKKEKSRLEKMLNLARASWPNTGCTIVCVNRLDGTLGCLCVNFFVASPRLVMFLKEVDIIGGDGPDNLFINELQNVIEEVGSSNVVQVITRLGGQASDVFESVILAKFPNMFWSHCTSHSILLLMEEIAEFDWMKDVVSSVKQIESSAAAFKSSSFGSNYIDFPGEFRDQVSEKFAPSYCLVRRFSKTEATLRELVLREEWKEWRLCNNVPKVVFSDEAVIARDDFWANVRTMIDVFEPFMTTLATMDVDKSIMGDVYNWRVLSLEALSSKEIDRTLLDQVELLLENRWDKLFSSLHGAAYILNPRYFGRGQSTVKSLMRAWNTTIERYESETEARRGLIEELGTYWKVEGSFGEADAVECRDKMEGVSWWENFGFETPRLQTLAVKILSQIPSAGIMCQENWQLCDSMPCREAVQRLGFEPDQSRDFVFVRNNLKLQSLKYGKPSC